VTNIYSGEPELVDPWVDVPPPDDETAAPASTLCSQLLSLSDLSSLPPVRPLVDGLLYRDTLAQLSGPPGSYKSFLALGMALAVALGMDWEGHRVPEGGPVVYVAAEGATGLRARVLAWCELTNVEPADLDGRIYFLPVPIQLGNTVDVVQAVDMVRAVGAILLVLDTRARCTLGLEENSATEQGKAVHNAEAIQRAAGCTVFPGAPRRAGRWCRPGLQLLGRGSLVGPAGHRRGPPRTDHLRQAQGRPRRVRAPLPNGPAHRVLRADAGLHCRAAFDPHFRPGGRSGRPAIDTAVN